MASAKCECIQDQTTGRADFGSTQYLSHEQQITSLEDEIARLHARRRQQARRDAPRVYRPSADEDGDPALAEAWSPILARSSPSEDAIPMVDEVISDVEEQDDEESSFSSSSAASGKVTRPDERPATGQDSRSDFDSPGPEIEDFEWLSTPEAPEVEDFEEAPVDRAQLSEDDVSWLSFVEEPFQAPLENALAIDALNAILAQQRVQPSACATDALSSIQLGQSTVSATRSTSPTFSAVSTRSTRENSVFDAVTSPGLASSLSESVSCGATSSSTLDTAS